ncbi:MAG TPA: CRTAC1 family protein [Planctomycetes bacterium]|nr:CRTAC1 family protein [Planctomycetota bacterium]
MTVVARHRRWSLAAGFLLAIAPLACTPSPTASPIFIEVDSRCGIPTDERLPNLGDRFMPESMAPGCLIFDCDGDGDLDLYRVRFARSDDGSFGSEASINRLYRQDSPWRFSDITAASGLGDKGFGMGAVAGDIDNDGDLDLYVSNYGPDRLFRNDGAGNFTDITAEAGIAVDGWSSSALFLDVDGDGFLDIYVVRYLALDERTSGSDAAGRPEYPPPALFGGLDDRLLKNAGDGTFTDVSDSAGISRHPGKGLGVIAGDLDGDGNLDIYVANDGEPNHAFLGDGHGAFRQDALALGLAVNIYGQTEAGMGIAGGDVDGDGALDIVVTHLVNETHTLYRRTSSGQYEDATFRSGLALPSFDFTGFGTTLSDFDHDGDLDLIVVNGRVLRGAPRPGAGGGSYWQPYGEENHLFVNDGSGTFESDAARGGDLCGRVEASRGLASGDLDGDGDIDLVVSNADGTLRLLRNDGAAGHWLMVEALMGNPPRVAVGAVIEVESGGIVRRRVIGGGGSYLSGSDLRAHFGLGDAASVEGLRVHWPDGEIGNFPGCQADQVLSIEKGSDR